MFLSSLFFLRKQDLALEVEANIAKGLKIVSCG